MGKNMFLVGVGVVAGMVIHHYVVEKHGTHNGFDHAVKEGEARVRHAADQLRDSDSVGSFVADKVDDASSKVGAVADDVAAKVNDVTDRARTKVTDATDAAAKKTRRAADKAGDAADKAAAKARDVADA